MDSFGAYVESFLGPNKSVKFVIDDSSAEAVNCPADLLRLLHISHPVSQIINSALQSFHLKHGQGSTTFLSMICFWHGAFQEAQNEGIHLSESFSHIKAVIEDCIHHIDKETFNLEDYLNEKCGLNKRNVKQAPCPAVTKDSQAGHSPINSDIRTDRTEKISSKQTNRTHLPLSNVSIKKILSRSRHFQASCEQADGMEALASVSSESIQFQTDPVSLASEVRISPEVERNMLKLVEGISHGDEDRCELVFQAWRNQVVSRLLSEDPTLLSYRFDIDKFHIVNLTCSPSRSSVISGLLLPLSKSMVQLVAETKVSCKALMLNCDLTFTYRHLGYKTSVKSAVVCQSVSDLAALSEETMWQKKTMQLINELSVNVLLVRGVVDPSILDFCLSAKIIVIDNVDVKVLNNLSSVLSVPVESYLDNCDESNIISNIRLEAWNLDAGINDSKLPSYALIHIHNAFQTVALCAPCYPLAYLQEHRLWHIAHRLASVTSLCGKMVAGSGDTELSCIKWMEKIPATSVELKCAIQLTANVFQKFGECVKRNCLLGEPKTKYLCNRGSKCGDVIVIDDYITKIEVWRCSLVVAYLIANTQSVIYVGDQYKLPAQVLLQNTFEDL